MSDDLTQVKGIGPSAAKKYIAAGFDTIESIATADTDAISQVPGVGKSRAEGIITSAKEVLSGSAGAVPPTEAPKPDPYVAPAAATVSATPTSSRGSFLGNPTIAIPLGIIVAVVVMAYMKTDDVSPSSTAASSGGVSTTTGSSENVNDMPNGARQMPTSMPVPMPVPVPGMGNSAGAPELTVGNASTANQPQAGYPYYAPNPYGSYSGWNNNAYGNGYGNAYGNGGGGMDMNANTRANANSNVAGQGYGYNNPYYYGSPYGSPYGYGPYGSPYPVLPPQVGGGQN